MKPSSPFFWHLTHGEGAKTGYVYSRFVTYDGRRYRLTITRIGHRSNTLCLPGQQKPYYILWLDDMEPHDVCGGPLTVGAKTAAGVKQVAQDLINTGQLLSVPRGG
jgi:hypothetical protein